jgi:hypothetical protein
MPTTSKACAPLGFGRVKSLAGWSGVGEHFHAQARAYFDVVVKVSDDPGFKTALTLYNNDTDDTSRLGAGKDLTYVETSEGRLIDAKGVRVRYVRLYSNGNTMSALNHYVEVEVFGKK